MTRIRGAAAALAVAVLWTAPLWAQGRVPCQAVLDHADEGFRERSPRFRQYAWGAVRAHCAGQETTMRSDSVAWYRDIGRFDMVGRVRFRDTTVTLDADSAKYFLADERLEAYGRVKLVNLANGTTLTGPNLTYWRAVPSLRDTTELMATRRPIVEYRGTGETLDEPYLIQGDTVRLKGDEAARATGTVRVDRQDFHAAADSAQLELGAYAGRLIGQASVDGGGDSTGYHLEGREIAFSSENNELNWVQARDSALARSADFTITADTVEFAIADDQVQGGLAWGDSLRPYAVSTTNRITADSLAIDSPNQVLEELRGFGAARALSVQDSLDEEPDWIAGDTLIASFAETELQERYLDTLTAMGTAAVFYRIYSALGGDEPDIDYSRGDRIVAVFTPLGLLKVDVSGATADGVHLQRRRGGS